MEKAKLLRNDLLIVLYAVIAFLPFVVLSGASYALDKPPSTIENPYVDCKAGFLVYALGIEVLCCVIGTLIIIRLLRRAGECCVCCVSSDFVFAGMRDGFGMISDLRAGCIACVCAFAVYFIIVVISGTSLTPRLAACAAFS